MEGGSAAVSSDKQNSAAGASYTYWVRGMTQDAAPLPVPRKLNTDDLSEEHQPPNHLGSAWNRAGTWEEKCLNKWAGERMKELLISVGTVNFSAGKAEIAEISRCVGDAFLVTVRNKKRVGYTYELTLKIKGEWLIENENRKIKSNIDIEEFSFGELDDLKFVVRLTDDKDLSDKERIRIQQDLKMFFPRLREKLHQFEQELKER